MPSLDDRDAPSPSRNASSPVGPLTEATRRARQALRYDGLLLRRWAFAGATRAPEWFRRHSPAAVGTAFWAALGPMRAIVERNQALILGVPADSAAARRAARALFVEYAQCLTDGLEAAGKPETSFAREFVDQANYFAAQAQGRGTIVVTAHTGSWEIGGQMLADDLHTKVTMVMAPEPNEAARAYADRLRTRANVDVVHAAGHDPATALALLARLRAGHVVAIQIDRAPASAKTVEARFCGVPWQVPEGPFRLAQATGAPIVPVFLRRAGYRRYSLRVCQGLTVERRGGTAAVAAAAQRVTTDFERFVRAYPDQWFHFVPIAGT